MRKRVVSLGLAIVMVLGVSGVSGIREVRAEYKAVKVEKVGKEVKSKRGEMPKFLKESGVKGVKDDGEHVWIEDEWGTIRYPSKNTYYTLEEYIDGSYGMAFGDGETHEAYVKAKGLDSQGGKFYCVPIDLKNWKDSIAEAKKYGIYDGVYVSNPEEDMPRTGVGGKSLKVKRYVVIQEVSKGNYAWVGTYNSDKAVKDVRSLRMKDVDYKKALKYKLVQKVERDGVSVKAEPVSVLSSYLNTVGLQAPVKVEFGDIGVYTQSGDEVARGTKGKVKIPVGLKAGKYRYSLHVKFKDKKGKVRSLALDYADMQFNLNKTVSIKDYAKGYKPKVKVEKKKAYLVFGNKIKRVVINGQEIESKAATTKMNVSRVVTKNGTYGYEVYTEDGLVGTGKITVKGLKK